jgi:WW domain
LVEIAGVVYKRAISATGHTYYLYFPTNRSSSTAKNAIWKLPEDFIILDGEPDIQDGVPISDIPEDMAPSTSASHDNLNAGHESGENLGSSAQDAGLPGDASVERESAVDAEDTVELGIIEGFPDWRKVDCEDGVPYYFNIVTQETQWEVPS